VRQPLLKPLPKLLLPHSSLGFQRVLGTPLYWGEPEANPNRQRLTVPRSRAKNWTSPSLPSCDGIQGEAPHAPFLPFLHPRRFLADAGGGLGRGVVDRQSSVDGQSGRSKTQCQQPA